MKAIILAAGYATRLYPLTKDTPKPLLEIKGRPIIDYIIDKLVKLKSLDEVFVVTNDKFFKSFLEWRSKSTYAAKLTIVNDRTKSNEDRLGSLGDIKYVVENMKVIDDVIIIAGDNLFEFSLDPIYSLYAKKRKAAIALYDVQDMELAKHYGIVGIDSNNKIISFEEKPSKPKSTLSSTGVYIYPYSTIKQLIHFVENHGKMDKAGDFLEWLYKQDDVYCFVSNEKWYDIGTLDQLNKADKEFMK